MCVFWGYIELCSTVCVLYFPVLEPPRLCARPHTVPGTNNEQEVSKRKSEQSAEVQSSNLKHTSGLLLST